MLTALAGAITQGKEIKGIQIEKKEFKLSLITDDMILYIRVPKNFTRKLLETIKQSSKVTGYRITLHKSMDL